MGIYLNPGNGAFGNIRKHEYVDKTGLIAYINRSIGDPANNMTCVTRARRFGKSYAAMMLCAYYDCSCDSHAQFDDQKIAESADYERHLNHYPVLYVDMTWCISVTQDRKNILEYLQQDIIGELLQAYPHCVEEGERSLPKALAQVSLSTKEKFIFIIDEWDALFREAKEDVDLQRKYLLLLRGLFKGGPMTDATIAAAYLTGILPIKKYGTQSAMTNFREFTMVNPGKLAPYLGFTEEEVQTLCERHGMDFSLMQKWYDGYVFQEDLHVYNPNSVMKAIDCEAVDGYWTSSETYESLLDYLTLDMDGLREDVTALLSGGRITVNPLSFQNDMVDIRSKDEVFTLLVHLGYLGYDGKTRKVYIPNLEAAEAFSTAIENTNWGSLPKALSASRDLLDATLRGDADTVARSLQDLHPSVCSLLRYNDENSLSCAVTIAYYAAQSRYTIIREFPAGQGFADLVFLPDPGVAEPAMIVELKCDADADSAIRQIKERRYAGALSHWPRDLLLVGISYDKNDPNKTHHCVIQRCSGKEGPVG